MPKVLENHPRAGNLDGPMEQVVTASAKIQLVHLHLDGELYHYYFYTKLPFERVHHFL